MRKKIVYGFMGAGLGLAGYLLVSSGNVYGYVLMFVAFLCVGAILGD